MDGTAVSLFLEPLRARDTQAFYHSENIPTALAIVPNKREKKLKKILDSCQVELWR